MSYRRAPWPRAHRSIVLNEKISGAYTDINVVGPSPSWDIWLQIPTAGTLRLNLHRFAYLFPRSLQLVLERRSQQAFRDDLRCRAVLALGQEQFGCQLRDGHLGDHEHAWDGWERKGYQIRWPGYLRARDLTDASKPQTRRYQRTTFEW